MKTLLSIEKLSVQTNHKTILKNISFQIKAGDIVLLSGENGIGKSTVLKSIISLKTAGIIINGEIIYQGYGNVLTLNDTELQRYRSKIAYIPQKDEYSEMGNIQVRDILSESYVAHEGKNLSASEVNDLIDEWLPRRSDGSRIFDAKSKPRQFSGGEQRLLSVFAGIVPRIDADLFIIDEPLNNLDFINAKNERFKR